MEEKSGQRTWEKRNEERKIMHTHVYSWIGQWTVNVAKAGQTFGGILYYFVDHAQLYNKRCPTQAIRPFYLGYKERILCVRSWLILFMCLYLWEKKKSYVFFLFISCFVLFIRFIWDSTFSNNAGRPMPLIRFVRLEWMVDS